jgi:hypothetical protein
MAPKLRYSCRFSSDFGAASTTYWINGLKLKGKIQRMGDIRLPHRIDMMASRVVLPGDNSIIWHVSPAEALIDKARPPART